MFGFAVHGRCKSGAQGGNGARALRMVTGGPESLGISQAAQIEGLLFVSEMSHSPHFPSS